MQKKLTEAYLSENKIGKLIEYLFNKLILKQPEDPIAFLLDSLEEIKSKKEEQLIQKKDIETMFDMIDINSKGFVTYEQLIKSLENLQVDQNKIEEVREKASSNKNFNKEEFCSILVDVLNTLKDSPYN
jgi:Ca2+-binding EF-hand superfamily protein